MVIDVTPTRDRRRRDRVARLHAGAPRPRLREQPGRARHLHEHPLRHRRTAAGSSPTGPAPTRWSRASRSGSACPCSPATRSRTPVEVTGVARDGDEGVVDVEFARDERPRRARRRHRDAQPAGRGAAVTTARSAGRAAIAGIGQTEFSKESGRTELQLACEAVLAALDDAGLDAGRRRRARHVHDGHQRGDGGRAQPRHPRALDVHPRPVRRRRVGRRP